MTNTTTNALWHMPNTAVEALAHLVRHHGWTSGPADDSMVQAHRFAHGVDGRPDLADAHLDHAHSSPTLWPPTAQPGPSSSSHLWAWVSGIAALFAVGLIGGVASNSGNVVGIVTGVMIAGFLFAAYFAPTIIAGARHHHNVGAIAVINGFLGWTFIGWVVALAMAASATRRVEPGWNRPA